MSNPTTVDNQQPYLAAFPQLLHNRGWNYERTTVHTHQPNQLCITEFLQVYQGCNIGTKKQEARQIMLWMVIILAGACQSNNGPRP